MYQPEGVIIWQIFDRIALDNLASPLNDTTETWFLSVAICSSWRLFSARPIPTVKTSTCFALSSEACLATRSCDIPSVSMMRIRLRLRRLRPLNKYLLVKASALPMYVLPRGYLMLSMACCMCVTVFSWPNLNSRMGLVEKRTAPTRDWVLEIGSVTTMDLMNLSISLKLPRPWYSMLPEPSIKNARSTTVLQAEFEEYKSIKIRRSIVSWQGLNKRIKKSLISFLYIVPSRREPNHT